MELGKVRKPTSWAVKVDTAESVEKATQERVRKIMFLH